VAGEVVNERKVLPSPNIIGSAPLCADERVREPIERSELVIGKSSERHSGMQMLNRVLGVACNQ
jgi:hypothetical protein